jgi:hypothetical protein
MSCLAELSESEWDAVMSITQKCGTRGLLVIVLEMAEINSNKILQADSVRRNRGERIARELGALIERMDGFEELEMGK